MGTKTGLLAAMLLGSALAMPAMAQSDSGATTQPSTTPPAGQNGGGRRGNFDPTQMRQMMMQRIKERLGASDDEFAAIQPKLEKVMQLERDASGMSGMRAMFGGRNGRSGRGGRENGGEAGGSTTTPPPSDQQEQSATQKAAADLQKTLDDTGASASDIKTKLDALRAARTQAKADLAAAQADLQSVLTQRQEAMLVEFGILN